VLRGGSLAATLETGTTDIEEIARLMVGGAEPAQGGTAGAKPAAVLRPTPQAGRMGPVGAGQGSGLDAAPPRLELRNLRVGPSGTEPALQDISICIGKGEILGIGGIVGNGQRSLARVLAGKTRSDSGSVLFEGEDISGLGIKERLGKNIRWLPENPSEEALLPERPLWENFLLGLQRKKGYARAGFIRKQAVIRFSEEQVSANNIAARGPLQLLSGLSGGNRQKVALARVLGGSPLLAILEQPCRGLDLRAAATAHNRMVELGRGTGASFILISYDFDELISVCDRIAVIYRGELMGTDRSENLSREILGRWAGGVKDQAKSAHE